MTIDYSDYSGSELGENALASLRDLALQQHNAELEVAMAEAALTQARERLRLISEVKLPEMMDELGVPEFKTKDGLKISIKENIYTSMGRSDEEKAAALDWLESNGHGHLIKRTVEVPFSKGQDKDAIELEQSLRDQGRRAAFRRKVEPMTLKSFVVEKLEAGTEIPLDVFKVTRMRTSRVDLGN